MGSVSNLQRSFCRIVPGTLRHTSNFGLSAKMRYFIYILLLGPCKGHPPLLLALFLLIRLQSCFFFVFPVQIIIIYYHFGANGFLQQLQLRMRLSSTAFYRGITWFSTMAPLLPKCHLIPVSTTTTPSKIGDQSSTVTLIPPGKKPASSTVFLSELQNLVCFLFFSIIPD